jgi:hypothetical protein
VIVIDRSDPVFFFSIILHSFNDHALSSVRSEHACREPGSGWSAAAAAAAAAGAIGSRAQDTRPTPTHASGHGWYGSQCPLMHATTCLPRMCRPEKSGQRHAAQQGARECPLLSHGQGGGKASETSGSRSSSTLDHSVVATNEFVMHRPAVIPLDRSESDRGKVA